MEAFGWVLAGFCGITAVLIAWQIFSIIAVRKIINKQVNDALPKIEGEAVGVALMSTAKLFEDRNEGEAVKYNLLAIREFSKSDKRQREIEDCLGVVERTLRWLDANQRSIRLKQDEMFDFVETLRKINSEKSKRVLDWLLKIADVERKPVSRFNG